jgi:hypothetical protein
MRLALATPPFHTNKYVFLPKGLKEDDRGGTGHFEGDTLLGIETELGGRWGDLNELDLAWSLIALSTVGSSCISSAKA